MNTKSSVKTVYNEEEAGELMDEGYTLFSVFEYKEYAYNHELMQQAIHDVYLAYTLVKKVLPPSMILLNDEFLK